ncbi:MAG: SIS domain-containing protein [Bacillota bacterium]
MSVKNAMRDQVWSLPELMLGQYEDLETKIHRMLTTPEIFSIQRILLTGCGDSYAAALATKHIFELLTGLPTDVVTAIDLARYYHPKQIGFAPKNPLVIALSNSGGVARISEAVQFVNAHGGFTLGITGNASSALGSHASRILKLDIPAFADAPGVRSYMVSVMALLLLAIRIGEVRGMYTMNEASFYRADIASQAKGLASMLPGMDEHISKLAARWQQFAAFDFVGAGFDYAAAFYGHAKILEATGRVAMHINAEEWLHLNFFARDVDRIGTVFVANSTNPAISRVLEALRYAVDLGRPLVAVSDRVLEVPAEYVLVPATKTQITMPLTQFAPLALLAAHLCELLGEEYGRGCKGPWAFAKDGSGVRGGTIHVRKTVLQ